MVDACAVQIQGRDVILMNVCGKWTDMLVSVGGCLLVCEEGGSGKGSCLCCSDRKHSVWNWVLVGMPALHNVSDFAYCHCFVRFVLPRARFPSAEPSLSAYVASIEPSILLFLLV